MAIGLWKKGKSIVEIAEITNRPKEKIDDWVEMEKSKQEKGKIIPVIKRKSTTY